MLLRDIKPFSLIFVWREGCPENLRKFKECIWMTSEHENLLINPATGESVCFSDEYQGTPLNPSDIIQLNDYLKTHFLPSVLDKLKFKIKGVKNDL